MCASYIIIRTRVRRALHTFDIEDRRNMKRNIKLSNTLFIVVGLSLACWLPATELYLPFGYGVPELYFKNRYAGNNCFTYGQFSR